MDAAGFWVRLLATPLLLIVLTWYGARRGARAAGIWAAFPVVTGPILGILAYQHGPDLVVDLLDFTLPTILANLAFGLAFAWGTTRRPAGGSAALQCLALGLLAYAGIAALIVALQPPVLLSACLVALSLWWAPRAYPRAQEDVPLPVVTSSAIYWQKACTGGVVVVLVTYGTEAVGHRWGGVLAMFPAMASVMATYYHGHDGGLSRHFLRGMPKGYWSFAAFCLSLQGLLALWGAQGRLATGCAFGGALAVALGVQWGLVWRADPDRATDPRGR